MLFVDQTYTQRLASAAPPPVEGRGDAPTRSQELIAPGPIPIPDIAETSIITGWHASSSPLGQRGVCGEGCTGLCCA